MNIRIRDDGRGEIVNHAFEKMDFRSPMTSSVNRAVCRYAEHLRYPNDNSKQLSDIRERGPRSVYRAANVRVDDEKWCCRCNKSIEFLPEARRRYADEICNTRRVIH